MFVSLVQTASGEIGEGNAYLLIYANPCDSCYEIPNITSCLPNCSALMHLRETRRISSFFLFFFFEGGEGGSAD